MRDGKVRGVSHIESRCDPTPSGKRGTPLGWRKIQLIPVVEDGLPTIGTTIVAVAGDGREPFQDAVHAEDVAAVKSDGDFRVVAAEEGFGADCTEHVAVDVGCEE